MRKPSTQPPEYGGMYPSEWTRTAEEIRESERREIARDLHDTVIQPLASLVAGFQCWEHQPLSSGMVEAYLGAWRELAQEALDSLRCTLTGLHTHPHAQLGLPDAVRRYLAPVIRSRGLRLTLESRDWPPDLSLDVTSSLYLAVREALTNAVKHAHASEVTVLIQADLRDLHVCIADNGVGYGENESMHAQPRLAGSGFGLAGMFDRIHALGGRLTVTTAPGCGVQLRMQVPRRADWESASSQESTAIPFAQAADRQIIH